VEIGKRRAEQLAKAFDVHPAIIMFPEYEAREIQKAAWLVVCQCWRSCYILNEAKDDDYHLFSSNTSSSKEEYRSNIRVAVMI
jgi:hypothetical protein